MLCASEFSKPSGLIPLPFMRKACPTSDVRRLAMARVQELIQLGFTGSMVRTLIRALIVENARYRIEDSLPTIGDVRKALMASQSLASQLSHVLIAVHGCNIGADKLSLSLTMFARTCGECLATLPHQSRRRNHEKLIVRIAQITAPLQISVTPRAGTRFFIICAAAFALAGVTKVAAKKGSKKASSKAPPSPAASIRSYLKNIGPDTTACRNLSPSNARDFTHCTEQNSPADRPIHT